MVAVHATKTNLNFKTPTNGKPGIFATKITFQKLLFKPHGAVIDIDNSVLEINFKYFITKCYTCGIN